MDPQLQALGVQLAEAAVRNTASTVADRITAAKTRKRNEETLNELEEIVSGLIADKSELVRIAQAFEEELVAQRISASDVEYITRSIVPVIKQLIEAAPSDSDQDASAQEMIDLLQPVLSVETLTVLQLLGFNFRKAIGEPLTDLVSHFIMAQGESDPSMDPEIQRLNLRRELAYLEVAKDPEAHARLSSMVGQP